ncbi:MAG: hypothetical protein ACYTEQ_25840 [Planctomycetota bacterium]
MAGNKRIDDLKEALEKGKKRNGNHFITCTGGLEFPDMERCKDCDLNLGCLAVGHVPHMTSHGVSRHRPCLIHGPAIRFYYHDSLCLSFSQFSKLVTDHGMWGYSVTTSRSIRWYLEALRYEGLICSQVRVDELCKQFKNRPSEEADQWVPVA